MLTFRKWGWRLGCVYFGKVSLKLIILHRVKDQIKISTYSFKYELGAYNDFLMLNFYQNLSPMLGRLSFTCDLARAEKEV